MSCLGRVVGTALVAGVVAVVASAGSGATIVSVPAVGMLGGGKGAAAPVVAAETSACVGLPAPGVNVKLSRSTKALPVPADFKARYVAAGKKYGLPWQLLAGVGMIETHHGANVAVSSAGAQGPMQFMPGTWSDYGVDGDGDGRKDVNDPDDAVPAAASYLVASGAKTDPRKALFAYNRADWYVNDVLTYAAAYGAGSCDPQTVAAGPVTDKRACKPTGSPAEKGVRPDTLAVMRCSMVRFPKIASVGGIGNRPNKSDHPMGYAADLMIGKWQTKDGNAYGWQVARWAVANADKLNVSYVIWDDQIWRARTKTWAPYTHPNGPTRDPNLRHLNHVHVSVNH